MNTTLKQEVLQQILSIDTKTKPDERANNLKMKPGATVKSSRDRVLPEGPSSGEKWRRVLRTTFETHRKYREHRILTTGLSLIRRAPEGQQC